MQLLIPAFFFILIGGGFLKAILGRAGGSAATAAGLGVIAWLLFGIGIAAAAAVVGFLLSFANTGTGSGGWTSGGGSWGGSSGGSSWGGGGGGSFGGGGSSGSW